MPAAILIVAITFTIAGVVLSILGLGSFAFSWALKNVHLMARAAKFMAVGSVILIISLTVTVINAITGAS